MIAKTIKLLNLKPDEKEKSMCDLKKICENCTMCDLAKTRDKMVFGSGNPKADIVLIGEAPGAEEDSSGLPFVGRAGKFLTQIMEKAGLDRKKDMFIINTVKCRPPENRVPTEVEKAMCEKFLKAQVSIIHPKAIIFCGATSLKSFYNDKKVQISKVRGKWFDIEIDGETYKAMAIFHPSYLLRNHSMEENSPRMLMHIDLAEISSTVLGKTPKPLPKAEPQSLHSKLFGELTMV